MISDDAFWSAFDAHTPRWYSQMIHGAFECDFDRMMQDLRLKVWRAYARGQFEATGQIIAYGNTACASVITDALRHQKVHNLLTPLDLAIGVAQRETPEDCATHDAWRAQFWEVLKDHLKTPAERIAIGTIAIEMPPRVVAERWPHLFASIASVYNTRRNALGRLRRSPEMAQFLEAA